MTETQFKFYPAKKNEFISLFNDNFGGFIEEFIPNFNLHFDLKCRTATIDVT